MIAEVGWVSKVPVRSLVFVSVVLVLLPVHKKAYSETD